MRDSFIKNVISEQVSILNEEDFDHEKMGTSEEESPSKKEVPTPKAKKTTKSMRSQEAQKEFDAARAGKEILNVKISPIDENKRIITITHKGKSLKLSRVKDIMTDPENPEMLANLGNLSVTL